MLNSTDAVLFNTFLGYVYQDSIWSRTIKKHFGCRTIALTPHFLEAERAKASKAFDEVFCLSELIHKEIANLKYEDALHQLLDFEKTHSECKFATDWNIDRVIRKSNMNYEQVVLFTASILKVINNLVGKFNIKLVLGEKTLIYDRLLHYKMQEVNGKALFPMVTKYFNRIYFDESLNCNWPRFRKLYNSTSIDRMPTPDVVINQYYDITQKGFKAALSNFQNNLKSKFSRPFSAKINPLRIITYFRKKIFTRRLPSFEQNNPYLKHFASYLFPTFSSVFRVDFNDHIKEYRSLSNSVLPSGRYVGYLMHLQPEFTIDALANQYLNQAELIVRLAKLLPVDVRLVVKENPVTVYVYPEDTSYYRYMLSQPNVVLMNENTDSHAIIKNSEAIVTLTGTSALESFFFGKPCVLLGDIFYRNLGLTYDASSIEEVAKILIELLDNPSGANTIISENREKIGIRILKAIYYASYPGLPWCPVPRGGTYVGKENEKHLSEALLNELNSMKEHTSFEV